MEKQTAQIMQAHLCLLNIRRICSRIFGGDIGTGLKLAHKGTLSIDKASDLSPSPHANKMEIKNMSSALTVTSGSYSFESF